MICGVDRTSSGGSESVAPAESPQGDAASPLRRAVRWSLLAVVGRQVSQMACALFLARLLGPDTYGVISAATVYVTLTTLVLDQGLASALIQRPELRRHTAGAVATVNLLVGVLLAAVTWLVAPLVADFFGTDELTPLLRVLGVGLLLKAVAINPRAMLMRNLRFKSIAVADLAGGVLGAVAGITAGLLDAGTWSLAWQVLVTDAVVALVLLVTRQGGIPNLHMREFVELLPFSLRIFGTNSLAFFARNSDNILVGRYLGVGQLSLYSMAYRVLVIPVQLIGQTVNRVAFPTLSRVASDKQQVAAITLRASELLAMSAVPAMVLGAVAAPEGVRLVLGDEWTGAIPVLTILAIAGARETVLQVTHSLMRAMGAGKLILRYEIGATTCQLVGIVAGLHWGIVGVAVGFTVAGFVLTPVLMTIQRRLAGLTLQAQLGAVIPAIHGSAWGAGAYLVVRLGGWHDAVTLAAGTVAYAAVGLAVLRTFHRPTWERLVARRFRRVEGA